MLAHHELVFRLARIFNGAIDHKINKDHIGLERIKPDISLYFYKRDKSMRFKSVLSNRLNRIIHDIASLNNLHSPVNYKFEKDDFDKTADTLKTRLDIFQSTYEDYFRSLYDEKKIGLDENELRKHHHLEGLYKKRIEELEKELTKKKKN